MAMTNVLFVEGLCGKPRRDVVEGSDRDIDRTRLQVGEGGLPSALDRPAALWEAAAAR